MSVKLEVVMYDNILDFAGGNLTWDIGGNADTWSIQYKFFKR